MKGNQAPVPDLTAQAAQAAQARARLAPARAGAAGAGAIPPSVWEDAERQLTGMLSALATLQADVPALGEPAIMGATRAIEETPGPQGTRRGQTAPGTRAGDGSGTAPGGQRR